MSAGAAQAKHLTQDQYAMNHPAGRIGKRLTLRVADLMFPLQQLPLVQPDITVLDALAELSGKGHGCVLITSSSPQTCARSTSARTPRQSANFPSNWGPLMPVARDLQPCWADQNPLRTFTTC